MYIGPSALSHSASNALGAPSTVETYASQVGDQSWQCWVLDHAGRCSVRSRRSDQPWQTHDGRTCRAVFLARRVGDGWPNEGAVVRRPAYTARRGSPGLGCEDTYAPSYRAWSRHDLPHRASAAQHDGAVSDCGRISLCCSPLAAVFMTHCNLSVTALCIQPTADCRSPAWTSQKHGRASLPIRCQVSVTIPRCTIRRRQSPSATKRFFTAARSKPALLACIIVSPFIWLIHRRRQSVQQHLRLTS